MDWCFWDKEQCVKLLLHHLYSTDNNSWYTHNNAAVGTLIRMSDAWNAGCFVCMEHTRHYVSLLFYETLFNAHNKQIIHSSIIYLNGFNCRDNTELNVGYFIIHILSTIPGPSKNTI
jgi:hypothetical protein